MKVWMVESLGERKLFMRKIDAFRFIKESYNYSDEYELSEIEVIE